MTTNVTLRIDEDILSKAKHIAVDADKSISAWVNDLISEQVSREDGYDQVAKEAIKAMKKGLPLCVGKFDREELYEERMKKWT